MKTHHKMSIIEAKFEAHKHAWIRAEALKISNQLQAKQIAELVDPGSADIVKAWIKAEVEATLRASQAQFPDMIEDAVNRYCRTMFSANEQHFQVITRRRSISEQAVLTRSRSVSEADLEFIDKVETPTRPPSRATSAQ